MDLFILRHGKAGSSSDSPDDMARALTAEGRAEIRKISRWMRSKKLLFSVIATSPLTRALETAEIVARSLKKNDRIEIWDELQPGGDPDTVCYHAAQYNKDVAVLLVGHEPDLSRLAGKIITGGYPANIVLGKGGLIKIRNFSYSKEPSGELQWLLTPKQMSEMR